MTRWTGTHGSENSVEPLQDLRGGAAGCGHVRQAVVEVVEMRGGWQTALSRDGAAHLQCRGEDGGGERAARVMRGVASVHRAIEKP